MEERLTDIGIESFIDKIAGVRLRQKECDFSTAPEREITDN